MKHSKLNQLYFFKCDSDAPEQTFYPILSEFNYINMSDI